MKSAKPGRFQGTRGRDEAVTQAVAAESAVSVWQGLRNRYSEDVRRDVDAMVERGGLTLGDIEALEYAEHQALGAEIDSLRGEERVATAVAGLYSCRQQSRKHLRTLRGLISPIGTPDTGRARVPRSVAERHRKVVVDDGGDNVLDGPPQLEA